MDRWEFLVICRDAAAYKTITAAVQKINGAVNYSWNTAGARAYIARRKIDGIFLETALPGALDLIQAIRRGNSNRFSVIFGCADESEDATQLVNNGANFILRNPLTVEAVSQTLETASPIIAAERKRYRRHHLTLPVLLKSHENQQNAITANISRGGMAVRCQKPFQPGSTIQFAVELPVGEISGRGEVLWANTQGFMGMKFYLLEDQHKRSLSNWLETQERTA